MRVAHILFDEGLEAPLRGWVMRGRELLADLPDSPVHAALSIEMAWTALIYSGDAETALQEARRAVEIANRAGDPTTRALAINAEGRALVQLGQIEEGLALLDESTVAAMSGELDGMATVVLFCSTVCALQALAEYDRADQWTQAMEQWTADRPLGPFQGVCRVHRAEILRLRGAWHDAEREARRASEEVRPFAGTVTGWPLGELGSVRLRMGNLEGAEDAFLRATQAGWDPQPGIALLRLAQGDPSRPTRRSGKPWSDRRRPTGSGRPTRSSNGPRSSRPRWTSRSPSATSSGRVGRPRSSTGSRSPSDPRRSRRAPPRRAAR